jgi:hypothetical protein
LRKRLLLEGHLNATEEYEKEKSKTDGRRAPAQQMHRGEKKSQQVTRIRCLKARKTPVLTEKKRSNDGETPTRRE